jgi:cytochrome d ubiquinol oxidase subunit II
MTMETFWFAVVAFMLAAYVILDGFDLGAGVVHLLGARTRAERRMVLAAVGPVWDGNEVWLLAAGGTLYFAFPMVYASSFSGFYLPLIIVLWLLILRAIGIEFRNHIQAELWQNLFDTLFSVSSMLLTIFFGAALGNVIRGVPLDSSGYFFEPLWTTFNVGPHPGILDWYTILSGLTAFTVLTGHGALYIAVKTEGELRLSARKIAGAAWWGTALLTVAGLGATLAIRPELLDNYRSHGAGLVFPAAVVAGIAGMAVYRVQERDKAAFVSSALYIAAMLGGAAFALYPSLLSSCTDPSLSLTAHNAAASPYGLSIGLVWWTIGIILTLGYFTFVYRSFRGKVRTD